ncbi:MC007 [Molluscum contagiosum virus subtype 2]|uniref:MC007 n=2 Tax=Molluscum contagiosum virus TaxID=10279 RepID=A0A1S7DLI7_MCV2|nr:MC007 [Molluscum contagiosum virus subtype 2]QHW16388.1 MC007L [Molluscum contagiosum virus]AYO87637.1 MC007 [Molluscum contagiosum virus subtype 2]AYO87807.1 MC007 [Molluscum contagiosum virus subtype 2]AYO87977.1 MC007 [Molluscum contagiosum virus subtype 2]
MHAEPAEVAAAVSAAACVVGLRHARPGCARAFVAGALVSSVGYTCFPAIRRCVHMAARYLSYLCFVRGGATACVHSVADEAVQELVDSLHRVLAERDQCVLGSVELVQGSEPLVLGPPAPVLCVPEPSSAVEPECVEVDLYCHENLRYESDVSEDEDEDKDDACDEGISLARQTLLDLLACSEDASGFSPPEDSFSSLLETGGLYDEVLDAGLARAEA